eukprot:234887_1
MLWVVSHLRFENLIVADYHFEYLSLIESKSTNAVREILYVECYHCKFINLTFTCSSLINGTKITLLNSTISNIVMSCPSETWKTALLWQRLPNEGPKITRIIFCTN